MSITSINDSTPVPMTGNTSSSGLEVIMDGPMVLKSMNEDELQRLIPTIIFLAIISVLGIFGNGIVCHVYRTRYRLSNSQCFILCLSAIDLFTCALVIPFEIVTVIDQYTFTELWLCKFSRFCNTIGTMSSSFLLLVIAIDRYRKVCKPFGWQISSNVAKILCGVSIIFGLVLALPAVFIYGKQTFTLSEAEIRPYGVVDVIINGTECSTDDKWAGTMFPFLNVAVFGTLFVTGIVTICILYCFIGAEVKRHANTMPGSQYSQYSNDRNCSIQIGSTIDDMRKSNRISGELIHEITPKDRKDSKRKSKYRISKIKKSESDLSWTGNNDELSYTIEYSGTNTINTLQRGTNMELMSGVTLPDKNEGNSNTDSEDSGIKSDQVIHENVDMEEEETDDMDDILNARNNDDSTNTNIKEDNYNDNTKVDTEIEKETNAIITELVNSQNEMDSDSPTAQIIPEETDVDNTNEEKDDEVVGSTTLGSLPSTSEEHMISSSTKYTKNQRSMSKLSLISNRISNAIRRMTSVTSMTSSMTLRKTQYYKQARARKTAFLMFMISLAFVLSYLPHLLLMLMRQLQDEFVDGLSDRNKAVYKFFLRSYFLNSAINPIIYGVCDTRFRSACKELFSCCFKPEEE